MYDSRIGRFFTTNPLEMKYPYNSPYAFSENDVIRCIELEGLEKLIVSDIDSKKRKANLTIKKTALIVKDGIGKVPQHSKFTSKGLNNIFKKGNTTLFVKELPTKGQETQFFTRGEWKNGKAFKIKVKYEVDAKFVNSKEAFDLKLSDPVLYSTVTLGLEKYFDDPKNPAQADFNGPINSVILNPSYFGDKPTGKLGLNGEEKYAAANEVLAHEVGSHNMQGHEHPADKEKKAKEYGKPGLKGSVPDKVYPTENETKGIIIINNNNIENGS